MAAILIVENDDLSANLFKRLLEKRGHTTLHTSSGLKAIEMVVEQAPDLILLDLGLPDLDGTTVAGIINQMSRADVPIIAVTGRTGQNAEQRALSQGCCGYITKPIDTRTFGEQIEAYLNLN